MKQLGWLVTVLVAACGDGGSATPDAAIDAPTMCAAKTAPLAPGMHKMYLNFDGVTLTKAAADSAPLNMSTVLMNDPTTIPQYLPAASPTTRQGRIDIIVDTVQRALSAYSVDVVTTRPQLAPYMMFVIGGKSEDFGFPAGFGSLTGQSCNPNYNAVGLEFDIDTFTATDTTNLILSDMSVMVGMGLSTRHNDCANRTDATDPGLVCSFDAMSATVTDPHNCGHTPTQDEPKLLMDAFGCRN